jgi:hypothetical protein
MWNRQQRRYCSLSAEERRECEAYDNPAISGRIRIFATWVPEISDSDDYDATCLWIQSVKLAIRQCAAYALVVDRQKQKSMASSSSFVVMSSSDNSSLSGGEAFEPVAMLLDVMNDLFGKQQNIEEDSLISSSVVRCFTELSASALWFMQRIGSAVKNKPAQSNMKLCEEILVAFSSQFVTWSEVFLPFMVDGTQCIASFIEQLTEFIIISGKQTSSSSSWTSGIFSDNSLGYAVNQRDTAHLNVFRQLVKFTQWKCLRLENMGTLISRMIQNAKRVKDKRISSDCIWDFILHVSSVVARNSEENLVNSSLWGIASKLIHDVQRESMSEE